MPAVDTQIQTLPLVPLRMTVDSVTPADTGLSVEPRVNAQEAAPAVDGPTIQPERDPHQVTAFHVMLVAMEKAAVRQHSAPATAHLDGMRPRRQLLGRVVTTAWSVTLVAMEKAAVRQHSAPATAH
eukprot:COSAG02_NODE_5823_length_4014_cov_3.297829_6_plen_125_part_01